MNESRYPPSDAREWLNRANSNLNLAKTSGPRIYLEELCFNAHQAAEKAIKGVFVYIRVDFPYTHDLRQLLVLLRKRNVEVPPAVWEAKELTPFAFAFRYPGTDEVTEEQLRWALATAEAVVRWAESIVLP